MYTPDAQPNITYWVEWQYLDRKNGTAGPFNDQNLALAFVEELDMSPSARSGDITNIELIKKSVQVLGAASLGAARVFPYPTVTMKEFVK